MIFLFASDSSFELDPVNFVKICRLFQESASISVTLNAVSD